MGSFGKFKLDSIGEWSLDKLEILRQYGAAYSTVLAKTEYLNPVYIDAFSGPGEHIVKDTGELVPGSPLNAISIEPPFKHYYFIDMDGNKASFLRERFKSRDDVTIMEGDCNSILQSEIFPLIKYEDYKRALCFLDPYGLHLDWSVLQSAAKMGTIEVFINFPVMDIQRNVVRDNPSDIEELHLSRMDRFFGGRSWFDLLYSPAPDLFDKEHLHRTSSVTLSLVRRYQEMLKEAGFSYVPEPVAMKYEGKTLYYLFFASPNKTGQNIVDYIFSKYRKFGKV